MDGGVDQGPWLQERVGGGVGAGWEFQRRGRVAAWFQRGASPRVGLLGSWRGQGLGGESKGFGSGKVGVLRVAVAVCLVLFGGEGVGLAGQGLGGGSKGFGSGGGWGQGRVGVVGARAPETEQISQRVSYFCRF